MEEESKKEVREKKKEEKETPMDKMTVKELREMARQIPAVTGASSMKKEELLDVIKKAEEKGEEKREEEKKGEEKGEEEKERPLEKMTAKELKEIAREIPGVNGVHAMKKEQLLEVIKKARVIEEGAPAVKRVKKKGAEKEVSIPELKQKIVLLKKGKEEARLARDTKKVDIFRRRINRLKKRTRKAAQA